MQQKTYEVRYLPQARITIDGLLDEADWDRANVERGFSFPWEEAAAPATEFRALCNSQWFYFAFHVEDEDLVVQENFQAKTDVMAEDRVELFFAPDETLKEYFCLEVDPFGRVLDYKAAYHRQFDFSWSFPGLCVAASSTDRGYAVEGSIPLEKLDALSLQFSQPGCKIRCGIFRAEFSHAGGSSPAEHWISWIDPQTQDPDFHIIAAFGFLRLIE